MYLDDLIRSLQEFREVHGENLKVVFGHTPDNEYWLVHYPVGAPRLDVMGGSLVVNLSELSAKGLALQEGK